MIPLSPRARRAPGTPKQFRALLAFFVVRHLLGVAVFGWLTAQTVRSGEPFWWVMGGAMAVYGAFVVVNGVRLRGQYVRSLRSATAAGVVGGRP